ncbi:MAG TPA: Gfo/Idh/MocA family oxidoreductase [Solirubrobacterales bacterium]|nr:Gfo/Idh/MocA family oxidoreductase [Solirubrobacterales bacterium]
MRIGIAGCGRIAEIGYLPAARATQGVEIVAFADPDRARLERCQAQWQGDSEAFDDVAALLERARIDLLVVAAPAATHVPLAEAAAAAGVRSLIEKPPAADLAGAQRLAALDPSPFIAFNRRFLQGSELLPSIPGEGWLELDLELRFRQTAWDAHEARDEALLDAGIHLIDLACHLSGASPVAVRRAEVSPARAQLELELTRGRAHISCATDRRHREEVEVRDRSGKVLGRSAWGGLQSRLAGALGRLDPLVLSLQRQLEAAALGVSLMEPPHLLLQQGHPHRLLATARDGVTAMAVVEAARRSAELGGAEVTVTPVPGVAA